MQTQYNIFVRVRRYIHANWLGKAVRWYYNALWGMHIGEGTQISLSAKLDKANPSGVTIGDYTMVTFKVAILTHDYVHKSHHQTKIGSYCFIGAYAIILPGITIGDHCIIGAGSVVTRDIPAGSIAVGNPARIIESGVKTGKWGRRLASSTEAEETSTASSLHIAPG